jgi:hypothetical protein
MKFVKTAILALVSLLCATSLFAQGRRSQTEFYAGAAFPLSPDDFKDFYKIGLSGNVQYVFFPSPRVGIPIFVGYEGFTVDADAISASFGQQLTGLGIFDPNTGQQIGQVTSAQMETEGSARTIKLGVGVRPYLTAPEAPTQFFLFGNATFNFLSTKAAFNGGSVNYNDFVNGGTSTLTITKDDINSILGQSEWNDDANKFGLGGGLGVEIPAGESVNLIFQGLFNIIFSASEGTDGAKDSVTFVGVTAGLVF